MFLKYECAHKSEATNSRLADERKTSVMARFWHLRLHMYGHQHPGTSIAVLVQVGKYHHGQRVSVELCHSMQVCESLCKIQIVIEQDKGWLPQPERGNGVNVIIDESSSQTTAICSRLVRIVLVAVTRPHSCQCLGHGLRNVPKGEEMKPYSLHGAHARLCFVPTMV
jgi:hypothetical protein